ncbi:hypothetical protein OQA88_11338 [Cercophora sp. LCS_1]
MTAAHVRSPSSPSKKLGRSFSDKLFRRLSDPAEIKLGIKAFYDPIDAEVDIVFIHGITGHLPQARILSFGYDAGVIGWRSRLSGNRIGDHARNLLAALAGHREADNTNNRPLIFVCHSLGGLVCQDALLISRTSPDPHLRQILSTTHAVLFLGTPHSGTGLAVVGQRLSRLAGLVSGTNARLVEVLRRDSEVLARIQDEFHALLRFKGSEGDGLLRITCVYEELPIPNIGEVVPRYSAVLPGYPAIGVHANHRDIARFATAGDPGFITVANELQRWVREAREREKGDSVDSNGMAAFERK